MLKVFSKPSCPQCDATYRHLNKLGVEYVSADVSVDADALAFVRSLGYAQAPVVFVSDELHWSGYSPDRLNGLVSKEKVA